MKSYCTCTGKDKDWVFRGLHAEPDTFQYRELWVHSVCCLPTKQVWEGLIRKCYGCLSDYPLPWTEFCYNCWKVEYPDLKYPGLINAANRAQKALRWPLPNSLKFNLEEFKMKIEPIQGDKSLQRKGSTPSRLSDSI